jgi:hypothetical protein
MMTLDRLRRMQWILRAALAFALLISMATNILHAEHDPVAQGIAAWSPVALFVAIEVMMRVPIRSKLRAGLRIIATAAIAGIAAWISYWHMVGVVARYEHSEVPYMLPLSVDGLILVLSVSLFDVANQIRERLDAAVLSAVAADVPTTRLVTERPQDPVTPSPTGDTTGIPKTPNEVAAGRGPTNTAPDDDQGTDHLERRNDELQGGHRGPDVGNADATTPDERPSLAPDLVPLLPAARAARDELLNEGAAVNRDALAQRLRRHGTAIRNNRVSELLAALKAETATGNELRSKASA